jgi:low temperature requirement protein LtrA
MKNSFRLWWQKPRSAAEQLDRQVSFLELFYDLVYVALIAQIAHDFAHHMNPVGLRNFIALFIIVWWAWINGTLYHELHGNNDIRTRVFTFLQMFAVVAMAIFAHDAVGKNFDGFAISYAFFQLILIYLWWRTGVHDPNHRDLSIPYVIIFLINTALFAGSVFVESDLRYWMWLMAMGLSIILPLSGILISNKNETARAQMQEVMDISPSLVERFGLFSIIVLGEIVVAVVAGTSSVKVDLHIGIIALLGTLTGIGLWWLYFDLVSHRKPKKGYWKFALWYYIHLPLTGGIVTVGASLISIIEHSGAYIPFNTHNTFITGVSLTMICIALVMKAVEAHREFQNYFKYGPLLIIALAGLLYLTLLFDFDVIILLIITVSTLLIPVFIGFISWLKLKKKSITD